MQKDSVEKIIERYLASVTRKPFTFKGKRYTPKILKVSPLLLRGYTCPPNCGGCCRNFSLDYLPQEDKPFGPRKRMVEFDGRQVEIWTDWQKANPTAFCGHLQRTNGRCGIYPVRPMTCDFELIRTLQSEEPYKPNWLTQKLYGRGWSYDRVDGGRGALCKMTKKTPKRVKEVIRKLERLQEWAEHFGVDTWIPDLIGIIKDGKLTKQVSFIPRAEDDPASADEPDKDKLKDPNQVEADDSGEPSNVDGPKDTDEPNKADEPTSIEEKAKEAQDKEDPDELFGCPTPEERQRELVIQEIIKILKQEKEIRGSVFFELREEQKKRLQNLDTMSEFVDGQIANPLAVSVEQLQSATKEEKAKALEVIKLKLNDLWGEVKANEDRAGKLLRNSVRHAKAMGDLLRYAQNELLEHGEYEDWVQKNFDGGLSTARGYTRIAEPDNWGKIEKQLRKGNMTIAQAWNLIKKDAADPAEKKEKGKQDRRHARLFKTFLNALFLDWEPEELQTLETELGGFGGFDDLVKKAMKKVHYAVQESRGIETLPMKQEAARKRLLERLHRHTTN